LRRIALVHHYLVFLRGGECGQDLSLQYLKKQKKKKTRGMSGRSPFFEDDFDKPVARNGVHTGRTAAGELEAKVETRRTRSVALNDRSTRMERTPKNRVGRSVERYDWCPHRTRYVHNACATATFGCSSGFRPPPLLPRKTLCRRRKTVLKRKSLKRLYQKLY